MSAHEALALALVDLNERGQWTACTSDPDSWVSDDPGIRAVAATACAGCAVLDLCSLAGAAERWHVWAGVDRTRRTNARRAS